MTDTVRAILGVVDRQKPHAVKTDANGLLGALGYKLG